MNVTENLSDNCVDDYQVGYTTHINSQCKHSTTHMCEHDKFSLQRFHRQFHIRQA